jgi:hypothetical protein
VAWTVKRGPDPGTNGFTDLDNAKPVEVEENDLFKSLSYVGSGGKVESSPPSGDDNTITQDLSSYTGTVGQSGSANFNLTYVPFSLTDPAKWTVTSTKHFSGTGGIPQWIIRNGVNDEPQDEDTDFEIHPDANNKARSWEDTGTNGNGAVAFTVSGWDGTGRFLAVGAKDKAVWSEDGGATWAEVSLPSSLTTWRSVAYGGGKFVVISNVEATWSEDEGATWTKTGTWGHGNWYSVAYGGGRFVAIGVGTDRVYWSTGGAWNREFMSSSADRYSVAYGDGRFVTIDFNNKAAWSTDGAASWAEADTLPIDSTSALNRWYGVAYGGNRFVAVMWDADIAAYSKDGGATWTSASLPRRAGWYDVAYGGGKFVAVGSDTNNKAALSTDGGATWTEVSLSSSTTPSRSWSRVAYGGGRFVAISPTSWNSTSSKAAWSTDGVTWTEVSLPSAAWKDVAYSE